jgi:hypothetical protein
MKVCDITGEFFLAGYVIGEGDKYVKYEHDLFKLVEEAGYKTLDEAYDDEFYYWSDWELDESLENDWDLLSVSPDGKWELWVHKEKSVGVKIPVDHVRDVSDLIKGRD